MAKTSPNAEQRALCHYAYAVGLEQSHDWCWALTQYASGCSYWYGRYYQSENEYSDNGWDYLKSVAYSNQIRYKEINEYLEKAEKLSGNRELTARCQYMRGYIEPEISDKQQYRARLAKNFADTKFHRNEMTHCYYLSMYR